MSNLAYTNLGWLPSPPSNFVARCRAALEKDQEFAQEVRALATYSLDQNQLSRLARLISEKQRAKLSLHPLVPFRLGLLSNSTVDFLAPALVATAARHGFALEVVGGEYGQAVQQALDPDSLVNRAQPDAVLIVIDYRGLPLRNVPGHSAAAPETVQAAVDYLETIRAGIKRNCRAVCLLQTLAAQPEALFGSMDRILPGTLYRNILDFNAVILDRIKDTNDLLVDVARLAETVGLGDWYSPQEWNLAKLPFADSFCPLYAEHVCRVIGALRGTSRKCLVLDLDNTLWGGVIGDDGLEGIRLAEGDAIGEAYRSVQKFALELRQRGILLAVCSKNEDETARLPFRKHPEMILRESHIAVFQANWEIKPVNIRAIAEQLSLGLESLVFLDDNPVERALVRQMLPEVAVPELPSDPALYGRTLAAAGYFESVAFSKEDTDRAEFYQNNAKRIELQRQSGDLDEYLRSLNMEISFQPFDESGRARIAQLINKSNQYNLTTRRYTEAQVAQMEIDPSYFTLQARLTDAFGDNGMISVVICHEDAPGEWEIDTWLMSCRVLGRRVEHMVLKHVTEQARKHGIHKLKGRYIPTDRNKLVEDHYPKLGFVQDDETKNGCTLYQLSVESTFFAELPITVVSGFA